MPPEYVVEPKRKNPKIIILAYEDIEKLMRGKLVYELPVDAVVEKVRDGANFETAEFFIRSVEFHPVKRYELIPTETMICERVIPISFDDAKSLKVLVKLFKQLIETGSLPDVPLEAGKLTTEYFKELIGALDAS